MILIADSGSTKTDWRIISSSGQISQIKSEGLNPFLKDEESLNDSLKSVFDSLNIEEITKVFFYGAGCKGKGKEVILSVLQSFFTNKSIKVEDDLLAAARATCAEERGIACILGTGANSCLYNGKKIVDRVPTLGYVLGDEGSGVYLGKLLINAFYKRELPKDLHLRFQKRYNLSEENLLEKVYQKPLPNQFIGSFARFLQHNIKHTYVQNLYRI